MASARIYHWQLQTITSLFHLFRGKKHNVLRNRIDSCDYDLDQLLLGTILFTLLAFLLPTVVVFYLTFATSRMAIIFLKAVLDTWLACLNHFPLFALMLRVKDSRRLPGMHIHNHREIYLLERRAGGISFDLQSKPSSIASVFNDRIVPATSFIVLRVRFPSSLSLSHTNISEVCPIVSTGNVRSILSAWRQVAQALPLTSGPSLPCYRSIRATNSPEEPILAAV